MNAVRRPPLPSRSPLSIAVRRAFTLVEVMVASFLFALLLTSLYASWQGVRMGVDGGLRVAREAQRARMAGVVLEQALFGAQFFQANAPLYAFLADTSGGFGALSFVSCLGDSFPGAGLYGGERIRRVTFTVDDAANGGRQLVLRQNSILAPPDTVDDPYPIVLASDVSVFQLEFWDPRIGEYAPEWLNTNQLPPIVRVTLGFGARKGSSRPPELVTRVVRIASTGVPASLQAGRPLPPGRPGPPGAPGVVPTP